MYKPDIPLTVIVIYITNVSHNYSLLLNSVAFGTITDGTFHSIYIHIMVKKILQHYTFDINNQKYGVWGWDWR